MIPYDCEAIRDLLPSLTRGEMLSHEEARADMHLSECAECRAEAEIVRTLQILAPVPDALEARVLAAVRRRSLARGRPARLAMAATLAMAVIGGAVVFDRVTGSPDIDIEAVSWAAAEDPLLHGRSELHELSVEQLELLLEEMDP
ncbi:MAG: zf-HC2 domain-containing protein [Gemmatimonadetes bacterium]|nr:zf-HC2 domain-containing protein [Gemmatimonadota bacterium]